MSPMSMGQRSPPTAVRQSGRVGAKGMDSPVQIPRHALADGGRVGEVDDTLDGVAIGLRARWLLDAMSGVVGLLTPHGAVLELNGGALEAAGLTRAEAAGRKLWELDGWYRSTGAR